jgi:sulfur-oxidizing protein SoxY
MTPQQTWTRRGFLRLWAGLTVLLGWTFWGRRSAQAQDFEIAAEPPPSFTLEERLTPILAGRQPKSGRVSLVMPEIAEDGAVVPVAISVESPMTAADHVRAVYLIVDRNPDPLILSLKVHPSLGAAEWQFKIRMAEGSPVRALAEMSDGTLYEAQRDVHVNRGGCD